MTIMFMGSMFQWSTRNLHLDSQKILWYPLHPAFTGFLPAGLQHQGRCRTQCCRVELFSRPLRPLRGVGTWERYGTLRSEKHQLLSNKSRFSRFPRNLEAQPPSFVLLSGGGTHDIVPACAVLMSMAPQMQYLRH